MIFLGETYMPGKRYVKAESCVQQFLPQTRKTPSQAPIKNRACASLNNTILYYPPVKNLALLLNERLRLWANKEPIFTCLHSPHCIIMYQVSQCSSAEPGMTKFYFYFLLISNYLLLSRVTENL